MIYNNNIKLFECKFANSLPIPIPHNEKTKEYINGFLYGQPAAGNTVTTGTLYRAYGKRDGKYYYIGLMPEN